MSGGKILGLRPDQHDDLMIEEALEAPAAAIDDDPPAGDRPGPLAGVVLTLLGAAWLAFVGWLGWSRFADAPPAPADIAALVATASAPLALLAVVALLLLRTSRREAQRFGDTAARMRAESAALERRLSELSARIEANREALAEQAEHLLRLGEDSAQRLGSLTTALRGESQELDRGADAVQRAAEAARSELSVVLASLPKAETQTRELATAIQDAGLAALAQTGALDAQLAALVARGREADDVAGGAAQRLAAHLQRMEGTSAEASERLEQAAARTGEAVDAVLARAAQAVDEARRSMEAQGAAMLAMVEQSRAALDRAGVETAETLAGRLGEIQARVDSLGAALAAHDGTGQALLDRLGSALAELEQRIGHLGEEGGARAERLAEAVRALGGHADQLARSLAGAGDAADGFIARAESLLTALDASAREIDETLPAALARLDQYSAASRERIDAMAPGVGAIETGATNALDRLAQMEKLLEQQKDAIELLGASVERHLLAGRKGAEDLSAAVGDANARISDLADGSSQQLVGIMLRVRDAAQQAAERARETLDRVVPEAAAALGQASDDAVRLALGARVESQIAALAKAAEHAVEAANFAADRLARQMAAVAENARALEAQVDAAREQADAGNRESFARRASLLVEALNSTAIDVTKILSNEVTDGAWAAYLKGDRGVFTRRAVRLLDAGEGREILRHYETDPEFREQVNRYIHDFEAMLKNVLATREGSQIAVTLLSSDMGKLYVALAQAIERLRT